MNKALFLGDLNKSDLLVYIAKVLTAAGKKVLLVDATTEQKYFLSFPVADPEETITEFNGFDVARSCRTFKDLQDMFKDRNEQLDAYDFLLIDSNDPDNVTAWGEISQHLLVTNFERYTIDQNVELLERYLALRSGNSVLFGLIIYPYVDFELDEDFLKSTLSHLPIAWYEDTFLFPLDEVDYEVRVMNQHENRMRIRRLSRRFRRALTLVCTFLIGEPQSAVRKAIRKAGRG
jgi:hypothetical protein